MCSRASGGVRDVLCRGAARAGVARAASYCGERAGRRGSTPAARGHGTEGPRRIVHLQPQLYILINKKKTTFQ